MFHLKITGDIDWQFDYLNKYAFPKNCIGNTLVWNFLSILNFQSLGSWPVLSGTWFGHCIFGDWWRSIHPEDFRTGKLVQKGESLYEGVQWSSVSDAAIRLINFLSACKLILHSSSFTEEIKRWGIYSLFWAHSIFYEINLWSSANKGEKYLICLLALHCTGVLFSQIEYGKNCLLFPNRHIEQK